ncbi:hypothetical protein [Halosimplex marinum]|uniref:hypothetical protein n=1 Tax=Halosimplex marinum TaxID=3396620 RepID=UPI003F56D7D9
MPLLKRITRLFGEEGENEDGATGRATADRGSGDGSPAEPSHVCQSCGKEYFADPTMDINTCQNCGGIKVERV